MQLDSVADYHVGGTINVDTGDGGDNLESRTITAIGTAGVDGTGITFTPGLSKPHPAGAAVTGSGNNIAATDPSAGAAVTPRLIARLEIALRRRVDRRHRLRPQLAYRARRTRHRRLVLRRRLRRPPRAARLGLAPAPTCRPPRRGATGPDMGWIDAGIAPPPNLATKLVARTAEPIKVVETFTPGLA